MSALESMIRVHQWMLDERRRSLAELQVFLNKLKADLVALDANLEEERAAVDSSQGGSGEAALTYPAFVAAALERRKKLCGTIANLEGQLEALREEVAEAYRELKKYELAQESQVKRASAKRARKERLDLDELAISLYRRNKAAE
jgi:flagellar export protein FliJ